MVRITSLYVKFLIIFAPKDGLKQTKFTVKLIRPMIILIIQDFSMVINFVSIYEQFTFNAL